MKKLWNRVRAATGGMSVRGQLFAAFGLLIALTGVVGGVALAGLGSVDRQADALATRWLRGVGLLADVRSALVEARDQEVKLSRTADASYVAEYEEKMLAAAKSVDAGLAGYRGLLAGEDRTAFDKLEKGWAAYQAAGRRVSSLAREKKQADAADISDGAGSMAFDETSGALTALVTHDFEGGRDSAAITRVVYARSKLVVAGLVGAALLCGLALAWGITAHLVRQLGGEPRVATAVARAVAEGDLTTLVKLKKGDADSLLARLASMQGGLADAVANVRQGSESVATASAEIAQGNLDLSSRTEEQAGALQQTAATMAKLGATVRENAGSAHQASELARGASSVAVRGGEVVGRVVETMRAINASSKQIAEIISVIDGIAFQTNILALNAAVEAARAGEQGRGFAVVAAEVRSLAQRSAGAAKTIKQLIGESVDRVDQGSALVDQAGATMGEIVRAIQRVTDIVGEIATASEEQSVGVAEVGAAVTRMDGATQQNAALVEQSAAAAESLREQSRQLVEAVAVFRIGAGTPANDARLVARRA